MFERVIAIAGFGALLLFSQPKKCPEDMVLQPGAGYCVDRYEWPNIEGGKPYLAFSALEAESVCAQSGKRLCAREEWQAACRGTPVNSCNNTKPWIAPDEAKVAEKDYAELDRLDQSASAGEFRACVSTSGAHDMPGNVEEWVRCPNEPTGYCLMGRYWSEPAGCTRAVTTHVGGWHYYETGFRCCADAE